MNINKTSVMTMVIAALVIIGTTGFAAATYDSDASIVIDAPYVLDTTYLAYNGSALMTIVGVPIDYSYYDIDYDVDGYGRIYLYGTYDIEHDEETGYVIDTDASICDSGVFQQEAFSQGPITFIGNTTVVVATDNDATVDMTTESYEYSYYDEDGDWEFGFWYYDETPTDKVTETGETLYTYAVVTAAGSDYVIQTSVERDATTEGSQATVSGDGSATMDTDMIVTDFSVLTEEEKHSWWYGTYWTDETEHVSRTYQMVDIDAIGSGQAQLYGYTTDELRTMNVGTEAYCDGGMILVDAEIYDGSVLQTYNFGDSVEIVSYTTTE